jgi:glycosyltransferase involved in cell wall biosynthesis
VSRAVFITQRVDPAHPNLGAAVGMVEALAERVDEVVVLALSAVPGSLPGNCRVRTFGAPTQLLRGARFDAALVRELAPRPQVVVAHMSPIYALLAAPFCRPLGVPVVLWFTHWKDSRTLRLAERASSAVATVDVTSFPFSSAKVHAIGHAVDVAALPCRPAPQHSSLRALALGRTSPAKDLESLIRATRIARERGVVVELVIRGPSETAEETAYREELSRLAGDGVSVEGPVPRTEIGSLFAHTDVLVNAAAAGSLDKVVYEACASCVPVLASNPGFADLLPGELRFERGNAEQLAGRLAAFAARSPEERAGLGHDLRRRVEERHSVAAWAESVLALAGSS